MSRVGLASRSCILRERVSQAVGAWLDSKGHGCGLAPAGLEDPWPRSAGAVAFEAGKRVALWGCGQ